MRLALVSLLLLTGCATRAWFRPISMPEGGPRGAERRVLAGRRLRRAEAPPRRLRAARPGPYPVLVFVHGGG